MDGERNIGVLHDWRCVLETVRHGEMRRGQTVTALNVQLGHLHFLLGSQGSSDSKEKQHPNGTPASNHGTDGS